MGLEPTPEAYIEGMVEVFREVWRVLRDDGTLWLNLGDSYWNTNGYARADEQWKREGRNDAPANDRKLPQHERYKVKDLCMIPARVALALQADGWYLRQEIVWAKPNPMPESVTDRCTRSHEMVYMLTKAPRYYYDAEAIKEPSVDPNRNRDGERDLGKRATQEDMNGFNRRTDFKRTYHALTRNRRTVWPLATKPFKGAHFATFPPDLVRPMIQAGTSEKGVCAACGAPWVREIEKQIKRHEKWYGKKHDDAGRNSRGSAGNGYNEVVGITTTGWSPSCTCEAEVVPATVLDVFSGAATTGVVALEEGRRYVGIELNAEYQEQIARPRLAEIAQRIKEAQAQLTLFQ